MTKPTIKEILTGALPDIDTPQFPAWRPIEGAKRDGTVIIGLDSGERIARIWWQPEFDGWISGCRQMRLYNGHSFEDGTTTSLHSPETFSPIAFHPYTSFLPEAPE